MDYRWLRLLRNAEHLHDEGRVRLKKLLAYGYREEDNFFLKIRAAFPGIAG